MAINSIDPEILAPGVLCFALGFLIALIDFHRAIVETGRGTAPITYFRSPAALMFCTLIAATGSALYLYAAFNRQSALASVFAFTGDSRFALAGVIPLVTISLLRSKIVEYQGNKFGLEQAYDTLKAWAVQRYKEFASEKKQTFIKQIARRLQNDAGFIDELISDVKRMVLDAIDHKSSEHRDGFLSELDQIEENRPSVPPTRTIEYTLALFIDNTSIRTVKKWADHNHPRR